MSALAALLRLAIKKGVNRLEVFRNSNLVVDSMNEEVLCHQMGLSNLMHQVSELKNRLVEISLKYV